MYTPIPSGLGAPIKITISTVRDVFPEPLTQQELKLLNANVGAREPQVAAMLLWMRQAPKRLIKALDNLNWWYVPLALWKSTLGDAFDKMRRQCSIPGEVYDLKAYEWTRKMFNLTYRGSEPADFEGEMARMRGNMPVRSFKKLAQSLGISYYQLFWDETQRVCDSVIQRLTRSKRIRTLHEWWATRRAWAPSGSSSEKSRLQEYKEQSPLVKSQDRANKKAVVEAMPNSYMIDMLATPPASLARASQKDEPGWKNRSIYASEDRSFFIASYASLDMEKAMVDYGMNARQTPADVADWVRADYNTQPHQMWISLDYSDYNKEHRNADLALLNFAMTKSWAKYGNDNEATLAKMLCSRWTAYSHMNSWVVKDGEHHRNFSGLFSGHRDTARDNTLLHAIYSNMVQRVMSSILKRNITPSYIALCGDDEDTCFSSFGVAALYYHLHMYIGWTLKPQKQMLGNQHHEYLQRSAFERNPPTKPINALIETMATGNWYTRSATWYDSVVPSVSDNCLELVRRGMEFCAAQRLARKLISAMMRAKRPDGTWKKLEWWSYRHGTSEHTLWRGTEGPILSPPQYDLKPAPYTGAPEKATQSWISHAYRLLKFLPSGALAAYKKACLADSYGKMHTTARIDAVNKMALEDWPVRVTSPKLTPEAPQFLPYTQRLHLSLSTVDRMTAPNTEQEAIARLGLDKTLVDYLGGLDKVWRLIDPVYLSRYEEPIKKQQIHWEYSLMDQQLIAHITQQSSTFGLTKQ